MTSWDLRKCGAFARGIWMDMLAIMWVSPKRGHLSTYSGQIDVAELARIVGESEADVKQAVSKLGDEGVYSTDADGTIYSRRMVREEKQRQSKIKAGAMGGSASRSQAERGPSTPTPSSSSTPSPTLNDIQQERFNRFWTAYPKKRSKGQAKKTWKKINPSEELLEKMLRAIERQKEMPEWKKNSGQFISYPSSWLNDEGWDDEILEPKKKDPWKPKEEREKDKVPF